MRILLIAPHPDDEAIGPGGTILEHIAKGDEVEVVLMTAGELGCPGEIEADTKITRVHEAFEASKVLGSRIYKIFDEPDGGLENRGHLVEELDRIIAERKPDIIYVTGENDGHPDHKAAASIVRSSVQKSFLRPEVRMYEVWSPMENYDMVVDISEYIGKKLKAIRAHESQVKRIRFDEAALALARFRGELHNRPHGMYAEVFSRMKI